MKEITEITVNREHYTKMLTTIATARRVHKELRQSLSEMQEKMRRLQSLYLLDEETE